MEYIYKQFYNIKYRKEIKDFNLTVTINQEKLQELMDEINGKIADGIKQQLMM